MIEMVNQSQERGLDNSNLERRQSTALNSKSSLIQRLMRGKDARAKFVDSQISKGTAFQIQSLRNEEGWSQQQLADRLETNQNAVYRLENPNYGKPTITTLKKVAAAFDVALVVRFVPFSQLIDWVTETPFIDRGLNPNALAVPSFCAELEAGAFDENKVEAPPEAASAHSTREHIPSGSD